ncbi:SDR family NAD(P)-dependent oxidoreductase [Iodidimonas sp. SYSU 1G8]|uniref:SDR family NAD(P)-dependent oxidoreductase n=1 Tax=Iodidimonas sp. SYSU 1G8 TaxID=3133967 RepID=UPI0031FF3000
MTQPLSGKIALVTGASRGIGRAAARALAAAGAHVIAVARTVGGLEELDDEIQADGGTATLTPLDLRQGDLIDKIGAAIAERWGRLDVLVGNAGILGELSPLPHLSPKEWDEVIAVNLTANWRLIRAFDPLLRAAPAGRALFLTSTVGHRPRAYWGAYAVSKAGLETLVRTYADELTGTPVRVNLLNPGATRTNMRAKAMPGEDPSSLPTPADIAPSILRMVSPDWSGQGEMVNFRDSFS